MSSSDHPQTRNLPRASATLEIEAAALPAFSPLLQEGVLVPALVGCSVQEFLCGQMGLDPDYVRDRILSIVLDGRPVDAVETATIRDGSRLALSSGMPGLVGATLRRGSILASFRGSITHREAPGAVERRDGVLRVKLFNLMLKELGPRFLERGIVMESGAFVRFLHDNEERLEAGRGEIRIDGALVDLRELGADAVGDKAELLISVRVLKGR